MKSLVRLSNLYMGDVIKILVGSIDLKKKNDELRKHKKVLWSVVKDQELYVEDILKN